MTPSRKRPQLTPDELRQVRWLLGGMLTLLGVWTVFYMDIDAWTLMVLTTLAAGAALIWPTLPARVPRIAHTLAFPVIVAFFAADLWLKTEVLPAMVRLDILLLLYRSVSYRQRRDDLQIIVLGLFLIVVAGVLTVSLLFAVQLLIYTACALAFLLVITLTETSAGPPAGIAVPSVAPAWAAQVRWASLLRRLRAATDWRVVGFGTALFAGVVVVSTLLFLAIPRFQLQNSMFLDRFITKKSRTGFSETVRFGDVTEIQQDDGVALSVDPSDPSQIPATPYWRMLVLDLYHNGTFKLSPWLAQQLQSERTTWFLLGRAPLARGPAAQWTFFLESGVSRYLPLLGRFERLDFTEAQNFRHASDLVLVALREEPVTMTAYRVQGFDLAPSLPDPRFANRLRNPDEANHDRVASQRRIFLDPASHLTLEQLRREAVGEQPVSVAEFTRRANAWLRGKHGYSLSPRIPIGPGDPLVRWLASTEPGHCELFAGSFVLLARSAGFYARVVTGFKGGSWNAFSNNFTIRNADAHAWAEIFDETSGAWLRADPLGISAGTQAEQEVRGAAAIAARTDRSWSARLDSLRVFWYRRIVSFDQQAQLQTLKSMKEATQNSGKRLRAAVLQAMTAAKAWLTSPWDVKRFGQSLGAVAALAFAAWLWRGFGRTWWRALRRGHGERRGDDPVRREAGQWLARMAGAERELGVRGEPVRGELQRLRFGARATWPEPEKVFRRARRALREARRRERATRS